MVSVAAVVVVDTERDHDDEISEETTINFLFQYTRDNINESIHFSFII